MGDDGERVVQADPPTPGYTNIEVLTDSLMGPTASTHRRRTGTVNPQWTWRFTQQSTWLAHGARAQAVGEPAANQPPTANFTSSCSGLGCNFTSTSSDPDGTVASYS